MEEEQRIPWSKEEALKRPEVKAIYDDLKYQFDVEKSLILMSRQLKELNKQYATLRAAFLRMTENTP